MGSPASDAPFEIANLCSNCQKVQFRDDIPQLYQSGPHLELDREQLPKHRQGWLTGGFLPTRFVLNDSYPELPKLWRSSQEGCDFCKFLHEIVGSFVSEDLDVNKMSECDMSIGISYSWAMLNGDGNEESRDFPNGLDAMLITAEFVSSDVESHKAEVRVVCHVESACDFDSVSQWLHLRNRSNQEYCDADSVQWMRQTLETCMESHDHDLFDRQYIPEQLIDVRPHIPQLKSRGDHALPQSVSAPKYTALSYCWGSGKGQAMTTLATLSDRRVGISESELPQVVRDAIQVTRALGIPFLWVDALCIIQDDADDWARQCTEMHKIYGSAHVTLCAANSPGCNEGFIRQTGRTIRIPFQSRRIPDIEGYFLIQYKGLMKHFGGLPIGFLCYDIDSPWGRRGWVFQENVLSTRRLIFGARDLYFLCSKCHHRRGQDREKDCWDRSIGKSEIDEEPKAAYEIWEEVLNNYAVYQTGSFTNKTDILPALSGLAQLFHHRLKDVYYAGHWGRNLYRSLLWAEEDTHFHSEPFWADSFSRTRSEAPLIPSWSNLNKGSTVSPYSNLFDGGWYDRRSEIHLLDKKPFVTGANPFNALRGRSLRLRGYSLDMSHEEMDVSLPGFERQNGTFLLMVYGYCYGILRFDCKPALHEDESRCVSESGFGRFKLFFLVWCDYRAPETMPPSSESGAESSSDHSSIEEQSSSGEEVDERQQDEVEYSDEAMSDHQPQGHGQFGSQEDTGKGTQLSDDDSDDEVSAASHDGSDVLETEQNNIRGRPGKSPLQAGDIVRKGFGLIICPTGNESEFYRVGMFSPITPRSLKRLDVQIPLGDLGGDIRELYGLAQVETIELV